MKHFAIIGCLLAAACGSSTTTVNMTFRDNGGREVPEAKFKSRARWDLHLGSGSTDIGGYATIPFTLVPLKGQRDYGELHCAFYDDAGHQIGSVMKNWSNSDGSSPIAGDLLVNFSGTPVRGDCWVKEGIG